MDTSLVAMKASSSSSYYFSRLPNPNPTATRFSPPAALTFFTPLKSSPDLKLLYSRTNPTSSSFSCSAAVTFSPSSHTSDHLSSSVKLQRLVSEFKSLPEPIDRVKRLLHYANLLPPSDDSFKLTENRVMGCTAQVWLDATMDADGKMRFLADSDSEITKGFCSCLISVLDGASPEEVLALRTEDLGHLSVVGVHGVRADSRVTGN